MLNSETRLNDIVGQVGKTAGLVWTHLAKNGKCSIPNLQNKTGTNPEMLNQALGWLAREGKVCLSKEAKTTDVWLTETENVKYKPPAMTPRPSEAQESNRL